MKDPRIETLAKNLINYSVKLQKGEKVLIENFGLQRELVKALVNEAYAAGGYPFVLLKDHQVDRALLMGATARAIRYDGRLRSKCDERNGCLYRLTCWR